jgi:hypothetical protein
MSLGVDSTPRKFRRNRSAGHQLTVALILIALGAVLFLDNVGVLPVHRISEYWPVILIAFGVSKLFYCRRAVSALWSLFFVIMGSLLLLVNLDVIHIRHDDSTWPLSLLCITFGFLALIKTIDRRRVTRSPGFLPPLNQNVSPDVLNESIVLTGINRRVESNNFRGGELQAVLGSIELDLRRAQFPPGVQSATLSIECVLASVEIRLPDTWRVVVQAHTVLANVEDKTIPPRADGNENVPSLIIAGTPVLSSVELEN